MIEFFKKRADSLDLATHFQSMTDEKIIVFEKECNELRKVHGRLAGKDKLHKKEPPRLTEAEYRKIVQYLLDFDFAQKSYIKCRDISIVALATVCTIRTTPLWSRLQETTRLAILMGRLSARCLCPFTKKCTTF